MGLKYQYVPIDRIFAKLIRSGVKDFDEGDVIEWIGEALEFIGASSYYEETVAFIEVKNHQCNVPSGTHSIIQIAKNNNWCGPKSNALCPKVVVEELDCAEDDPDCECNSNKVPDFIILGCDGQPITDYDVAYYRPYFDLQYEYYHWRNSSMYRNSYSPVRLKSHTFFDSLVCTEENSSDVYSTAVDEYTVIQGKILRFSFKEGSVAVAYNRQVVDKETGYPLIPDNISYTTAIVKYILLQLASVDLENSREGAKGRLDVYENQWQWYCKQASNVDMMPHGIDEHQNLLDQRSYMLPRQQRYFGFFGKMARPENRKWNDPDNRNHKAAYFLGN